MTPILIKNHVAEAAVAPYRIVKIGTADNQVLQAAAVGDAMFGAADNLGGDLGGRVDVIVAGIAELEAGGAITRGNLLTSDANGKAVAAAPVAGTNNRVIGLALKSAVAGDIIPVLLSPGQIQG